MKKNPNITGDLQLIIDFHDKSLFCLASFLQAAGWTLGKIQLCHIQEGG